MNVDFLTRARERREAMVARLHTLVEIESPSGDQARSAHIAAVLAEQLEAIADLNATIVQRHVATGTVLEAKIPAQDSSAAGVLLLGHSDTVWPVGTLEKTMPWRQFREDDRDLIAGPGVFDMKAGLVVIETALEMLAEARLPRPPVTILVACDEEIGSPESAAWVAESLRDTPHVLAFEPPHPDGAFKVGRRGSTRVRITVKGREAHAALDPTKGISAIDELVDQLIALRTIIAQAEREAPGTVLANVGAVEAPGQANIIPAHASALIGLRFTTQAAEDATLAAIRALAPVRPGAKVSVELLSHRPAWQPRLGDTQLVERLANAERALGGTPAWRSAAGAGDTNLTGSLGTPSVDGLGPRGAGAHAVNERIDVDSFVMRAALLARMLVDLAK